MDRIELAGEISEFIMVDCEDMASNPIVTTIDEIAERFGCLKETIYDIIELVFDYLDEFLSVEHIEFDNERDAFVVTLTKD